MFAQYAKGRRESLEHYKTKICYHCGKEFRVYGDWGYTLHDMNTRERQGKRIFFCSYSCMRAYEVPKIHEKVRKYANTAI